MKKLVFLALGAFVLSLGGTTGALVAVGTPPGTRADSTAADSAGADSTHHAAAPPQAAGDPAATDTTARPGAPPDTPVARPAVAHDSQPAGTPHSTPPAGASAVPEAAAPGAAVANGDAENRERESFRQLARIFANMKTADAVKVLGFMSDDEVQGVLEQLGVRQAAGLLGALPKERAAALSRRLLQAGMRPEAPR